VIRAALYLGIALMLLSAVFPNPFPVLILGGIVALGAYAKEEGAGGDG
jgi:hypothetical protein